MRAWAVIAAGLTTGVPIIPVACSTAQSPAAEQVDETTLREYGGVYRWDGDGFVYLQLWNELTGTNQLVAFDESGEVRTLYPSGNDRFFTGPGAAVSAPVESRVEIGRDSAGGVATMTWQREDAAPRIARRVATERWEEVRFESGDVRLAGNLITPHERGDGSHPAVILVHGSGPQTRGGILPFARFLVRHGMAVLTYDKRGVGASTGDWSSASFEDLAGDVVAAFTYLKARRDIDSTQIGLLGVSQAGWIMPLAAVRAPDLAFVISISGAGVSAAETTVDHARREMLAAGMGPDVVARILDVMELQYRYARTGEGWEVYAAARQELASRIGPPPESFPATRDHPSWDFMRRSYFHDPAPTLRQVRIPVLAFFGERDNNVLPEKNRNAWDAALREGSHSDFALHVLPKANHILLEAEMGTNVEMPSLRRFVPEYYAITREWLAGRIAGFGPIRD